MQNQQLVSRGGKSLLIITLFALVLSLSCQKERQVFQTTTVVSVSEAKQYFEAHFTTGNNSQWFQPDGKLKSGLSFEDIIKARQPLWGSAFEKQISVGRAVQIPLHIGDLLITVNGGKDLLPLASLHYVLMYKDALDSMHTEWVTLMPDSAWLYGKRDKYTGKIEVKDWGGNFIKGYFYHKQGSITQYSKTAKATGSGIRGSISQLSLLAPDDCLQIKVYIEDGWVCGWPTDEPQCLTCDDEPGYFPDPIPLPGDGSGGGTSGGDYANSCNPNPNYTVPNYPPPPGTQWRLPCGPVPVPAPSDTYTNPVTGITYSYSAIEQFFNNHPEVIEAFLAGDDIPLQLDFQTDIMQGIEFSIEYMYLKTAHPDWSDSRLFATAYWNVVREDFHFALDILGMFPLLGEAADITNGVIYFVEGDKINGAMSVGSAIPIWGWVSTAGKWVRTTTKVMTKPISEAAGKIAYRAITTSKGAVRMVRVAVSALDHAAIKALQAVKPADQTLTNLSRTIIDQFSHRISPPPGSLKTKVDNIVQNGDIGGSITEELSDELFQVGGFVKKPSHFGINNSNGFDGVYIKYDANNNVQEIIINEAKQVGAAGNIKLEPRNVNSGLPAQMSDRWIIDRINVMQSSPDQAIRDLGNLLLNNQNKITKTVTGVDKSTSEIVILKLDKY